MALDSGRSFVAKYGVKTISYAMGIGFALLLLLMALGSMATTVDNTEVGIAVNNVTGTITTYKNGGMVTHLPFGITTVYRVDKSQRSMRLTRDTRTPEHPDGEQVRIKTSDGSNVEAEIEVVFQIDVENAYIAYRELMENAASSSFNGRRSNNQHDSESNMESILRAVVRSEIRNQLGTLTTLEVSEASYLNQKLALVLKELQVYFKSMGVDIVSVNAKNFHFNEDYERIVRERKSADQILVNQKDFQSAKVESGKRKIAEATKVQKTTLAQLDGELQKRLLTAKGDAERIKTKAAQEAYQLEREGEIAYVTAKQEALALETEGKQKAEALEKLFEAYEKGGEGLVREALIKLYDGVNVSTKPYSLSDRIERIQAVPIPLENSSPARSSPSTPIKGGASGR